MPDPEYPSNQTGTGMDFGQLGAQRILDVEKGDFQRRAEAQLKASAIGKQNISKGSDIAPPPGFFGELFRALAVLGQQLASGENTVRSLRERALGSWPENAARDNEEIRPGQAAAALEAVINLTRIAERLNDHLHTLNDRL